MAGKHESRRRIAGHLRQVLVHMSRDGIELSELSDFKDLLRQWETGTIDGRPSSPLVPSPDKPTGRIHG